MSMTISNVGAWFGGIIFTRLSDLYGRKLVFCYCLWSNVVIATIQCFAPSYAFYSVLTFIDGMQQQGCMAAAAVLAIELFPAEQRNFAMNAIEFFWAFGYISLVPFAYYIRSWRYLQLAITLPLVLTVAFYWYIEESIPWLVAQGRYKDANDTMQRAAKFNKISIPENVFSHETESLKEDESAQKSCWKKLTKKEKKAKGQDIGVKDIFKNRTMAIWTLTLFVIWFSNNLTYYAVNYTVTYLPGDRYLNYFMYGLMEVPAYALTWILLEKFGRVKPLCVFHILAGAALIGTCVQTFEWGEQNEWATITLSIVGKFFITCSYATIFVHTPEIYPTNVRNTGLGVCMCVSTMASFVGPYARILARYAPWVPTVIMGFTSVVAGVLALTLPETRWLPLPETIEDIAAWKGKDVSKKAMHDYGQARKQVAEQDAKQDAEQTL